MKAEEVVAVLQSKIPKVTDLFSDSIEITGLTNASGVEVVADTVENHNLAIGGLVTITGSKSSIPITSLKRDGIRGTIITATDHDITNGLKTIEIAGVFQEEFNGTFDIINVDNRRVIDFTVQDSGPTFGSGPAVLINGESAFRGYNGLQIITSVPTSTQFTYNIQHTGLQPSSGKMSNGLRISAAGNIERILAAYTKQSRDDNWMFAVLGDVIASKSRDIESDGVDNLRRGQQGDGFRQQIIQPLTIYVFIPTSDSLTSRDARDSCEDIFKYICQSILFYDFDSGLSVSKYGSMVFVNHGFQAYNSAFYVHQYTFEQMTDITFGDTVGYSDDVAFRDIELIMNQSTGDETFSANINLDDEPLP